MMEYKENEKPTVKKNEQSRIFKFFLRGLKIKDEKTYITAPPLLSLQLLYAL